MRIEKKLDTLIKEQAHIVDLIKNNDKKKYDNEQEFLKVINIYCI